MQNAMGSKLIPERELEVDDAAVRLYGAYVEGQAVGVVKSVPFRNLNACWVSGLGVLADFQRQGFGRELMQTMLHDDQRLGFRHSVLLASKLGAMLYPTLGYETLGTLSLWVPQRDADA